MNLMVGLPVGQQDFHGAVEARSIQIYNQVIDITPIQRSDTNHVMYKYKTGKDLYIYDTHARAYMPSQRTWRNNNVLLR